MSRVTGMIWRTVVICICGIIAPSAMAAELYEINLSPATKVGRKYHLVSKATDVKSEGLQVTRAQIPMKEEMTLELDGVVTVFGVDSKGSGTWLSCKVKTLHMIVNGNTSDVVDPESILQYKALPLTEFTYQRYLTVNGKPVEGGMKELVEMVFLPKMPEAPTEQEMFGSATPQPIGGGWALNRDRGVRYMATKFMGVEPRDFTGKTQFVGIEKVGAIDCYRLDGSVKAAKYVNTYDANIHTQRATYTMKFSKLVSAGKTTLEKSTTEQHFDFAERGVKNGFGFRQEVVEDLKQEVLIEPIAK